MREELETRATGRVSPMGRARFVAARVALSGLAAGLLLGTSGMISGCSDPTREDGTQVEFDLAKQQEGMKKMEDYMQRKAKGQIPGIPKR